MTDCANKIIVGRSQLIIGTKDGYSFRGLDDPEVLTLLEALLPNPENLFSTELMVKNGTKNYTGIVNIGDTRFFLKRYNDLGPFNRFDNAVRGSRARRAWNVALSMWEAGLSVVCPHILLERKAVGGIGCCYVLMSYFGPAEDLKTIWPRLDDEKRLLLISTVGEQLGRMHAAGFVHGDLKWNNILVTEDDAGFTVVLVDFDGARKLRWSSEKRVEKDMSRFRRDLRAQDTQNIFYRPFQTAWSDALKAGRAAE